MIVAIEGGDQAGKKTQADLLADALKKQKITNATFSFPDYDTPIGRELSLYLGGARQFPPQVIHCLFSANRWEKLDEIRDAASKNSVVIMNRYYHSNLAYGMVNGLDQSWLESLDRGMPESDLVILLDISQEESVRRKKTGRDRFEGDGIFLRKTIDTYRTIAKARQWKIIDAGRPEKEVHRDITKTVLGAL